MKTEEIGTFVIGFVLGMATTVLMAIIIEALKN